MVKKNKKELSKDIVVKDIIWDNPLRIIQQSILPVLESNSLLSDYWYKNSWEVLISDDKKIKEVVNNFINETEFWWNLLYEFLFILEQNILNIKCDKLYNSYKDNLLKIKDGVLTKYGIDLSFPSYNLRMEYPDFFEFIEELNNKHIGATLSDYVDIEKEDNIFTIISKENANIKIDIDENKISKDFRKWLLMMYIAINNWPKSIDKFLTEYKLLSLKNIKKKFEKNYRSRVAVFCKNFLWLKYGLKKNWCDYLAMLKIR